MPPSPLQPFLLWEGPRASSIFEGTAQHPGCGSPRPLEGREQGAPFSVTSLSLEG